jgi:tetratricopeptide (TPR) repeat protein
MWPEAAELLGDAAARLEQEGKSEDARGVIAELLLVQVQGGHREEAYQLGEEALRKTPPDAAGRGTAALLQRHGKNLVFEGRVEEAAPLIDRAIGIASLLDDDELLATSLDADSTRHWFSGKPVLARLIGQGAVEASRASGRLDLLVRSLSNLGDTLLGSDLPALDVLREAFEASHRMGDPVQLTIAAGNLANALIYKGEWDQAASLTAQALEEEVEYEGSGAGSLHDRLALIHALRGDIDVARENLDRGAALLSQDDRQDVGAHTAAGAAVDLVEGDYASVLAGFHIMTEMAATFGWSSEMTRQLWPDAAEASLRSGDLAAATRLVTMLEEVEPGRLSPYLRAHLARIVARLRAANGEKEGVEQGLTHAIERFGAMEYPYWEAVARLDLAAWLFDRGRTHEARPLRDAAAEVFERLGAAPDIDRARRLGATALAV